MSELPYLFRLSTRLAAGIEGFEPDRAEKHRTFVRSFQEPDGGFRGREGDSDLYYTSFAVRTLSLLGGPTLEECQTLAGYLKENKKNTSKVVDLVSWLYSALVVQLTSDIMLVDPEDEQWAEEIAELLESFRVEDGGYAKSHEGSAGSTYHSFLIALCYELIGKPIPAPNRLIQFLYDRQRDDGGFVEIRPMKRSGTNPTAAAAALLEMLGAMDDEIKGDVKDFLRSVRSGEGGLQANSRIPVADTLSTFTGLLTAQDLKLTDVLSSQGVIKFVEAMEQPEGGFRAAHWDEASDVEYTFYALGCLALANAETD